MVESGLTEIRRKVRRRVQLRCDEMHQHSAHKGCLEGDARDVLILELIEELFRVRGKVEGLYKEVYSG